MGTNAALTAEALGLDGDALVTLARNSFEASFIGAERRAAYLARVDAVAVAARTP